MDDGEKTRCDGDGAMGRLPLISMKAGAMEAVRWFKTEYASGSSSRGDGQTLRLSRYQMGLCRVASSEEETEAEQLNVGGQVAVAWRHCVTEPKQVMVSGCVHLRTARRTTSYGSFRATNNGVVAQHIGRSPAASSSIPRHPQNSSAFESIYEV